MTDEKLIPNAPERPKQSVDTQLLERAGLNVKDAADLLGRTPQAIYQGLSKGSRYFGISDLGAIVNKTIASDSNRIDFVSDFIEANYPAHECDVVLPDRISLGQLEHAAEDCERLIFGFNGNIDHVVHSSLFLRAFTWAHGKHLARLSVVTGQSWLQECLAHQYGLRGAYQSVVTDKYQYPLSFVLIKGGKQPSRVFYFGRHSLAEAEESNADKLSQDIDRLIQ